MTGHPSHVADDMNDGWQDNEDQIETVPVRPEHLTEGMIVHNEVGERMTVMDTTRLYSYMGPDDIRVQFEAHSDMWLSVGEHVEVEC